jgi:hypothetical protein
MAETFDDYMRSTVSREFFRGMVGRQMFCPICQTCLDYRRAVLFNNHVVCSTCYAGTRERVVAQRGEAFVAELERNMAERLDFVDGRQWAPKGRKRGKNATV